MFGLTAEDLKRLQAEVMILIKAYDDTFSQTVLSRYSYRYDEIAWGRRFAPAFSVDPQGDLVLELQKVGEISDIELSLSRGLSCRMNYRQLGRTRLEGFRHQLWRLGHWRLVGQRWTTPNRSPR